VNRLGFVVILFLSSIGVSLYTAADNPPRNPASNLISSWSELTPVEQAVYQLTNMITIQQGVMRSQRSHVDILQNMVQNNPASIASRIELSCAQNDLRNCTQHLFDLYAIKNELLARMPE